MRRMLSRVQSDRGQVIIFFVVAFTVVTVIGVFAFDFGLWFNSRRSLQTDVDMAALAGAQELAKDLSVTPGGPEDLGWAVAGQDKALEYLQKNGLSPDTVIAPGPPACPAHDDLGADSTDAFICADTSCFEGAGDIGLIDTVVADAQGPATGVFTRILNSLLRRNAVSESLVVGAHAKACVGSLTGTTGLRPWIISIETSPCFESINGIDMPLFGEDCVLRSDNPDQTGSIRLNPDPGTCGGGSGASDYKENIVEGSEGWCRIGDIIDTEPGFSTGPTKAGIQELLATEGDCNDKYCADYGVCQPARIDDFGEALYPPDVTPSPDVVYTARDCTTPRIVDIVIVDSFDGQGMDDAPIRGFASFFVFGCSPVDKKTGELGPIDPKCDLSGGDFAIVGRFMNVLKLDGTGGALDPFGTRIIFLAE